MSLLALLNNTRMTNLLVTAMGLLSIVFLLPLWQEFFAVDIWRHDALFYLDTYAGKLGEEGRWINYLLFGELRQLNPYVSFTLQLASFALFIFIAARSITRDSAYSACLAALSLAAAPLYIQLLWPNTSLPAFIVLVLAALGRRLFNPWFYFALAGVLFFGTMSHLYFLLPLLFQDQLAAKHSTAAEGLRELASRLLAPWVAGYVIGFAVANAMTALLGDGSGITLAEWRRPVPAANFDQFLANLQTSFNYLARDLQLFARQLGWVQLLLILGLFSHNFFRNTARLQYLIPLLVIFSLYASVVPYSVAMSYRTSLTTWAGLVFLLLVPPDVNRLQKAGYSLLLASLVFTGSQFIQRDINWYRISSHFYQRELAAILDKPANQYQGIALIATRDDMQRAEQFINRRFALSPSNGIKTLGAPGRWPPAAKTVGFTTIQLCNGKHPFSACELVDKEALQAGHTSPQGLYRYATLDGWLLVSISADLPE